MAAKRQKTAELNGSMGAAATPTPAAGEAAAPLLEYAGHTVAQPGAPVERRAVASLTPEEFFEGYVRTRRPLLLSGAAELDPRWHGTARWSNAHLRRVAGEATVRVEQRAAPAEVYGRGKNVRMPFGELLSLLERGDARHYMTTQDLETDEEGRPHLMSAPCTQLHAAGDFPLVPSLLGSLIPVNFNLWMGNTSLAEGGSSSGLHHDFHDNLYVLLRGRKRFRLFSPADAASLYTTGALSRVHPNGRICYQGLPTHADGSDAAAVAAMQADERRVAAERAVADAEAAVGRGEPGAEGRLAAAEEELDAAMDAGLDAELEFAGSEHDDYGEEEEDDEDVLEANDDDEVEDDENNPDEIGDGEEADEGGSEPADGGGAAEPEPPPLNFSQVDLSLPAAELRQRWPKAAAATMTEVTIEAGEMLWLPAGWFHEVTSMSVEGEAGHMAFNYWFHPPDAPAFEAPYSSGFWGWEWEQRRGS